MSLMAGFAVVLADVALGVYHKINTIPFGIYGATTVGKTTLHNQLRTRGEVAEIKNVKRKKDSLKQLGCGQINMMNGENPINMMGQ